MLKGIDVNQRIEFVSKYDDTEPKTVFVLKPLSSLEMMTLGTNESIEFYLEKSIVEVKNFDNKSVKEAISSVNVKVLGELIEQINRLNKLSDEQEIKN
jgi:hypothetical protein